MERCGGVGVWRGAEVQLLQMMWDLIGLGLSGAEDDAGLAPASAQHVPVPPASPSYSLLEFDVPIGSWAGASAELLQSMSSFEVLPIMPPARSPAASTVVSEVAGDGAVGAPVSSGEVAGDGVGSNANVPLGPPGTPRPARPARAPQVPIPKLGAHSLGTIVPQWCPMHRIDSRAGYNILVGAVPPLQEPNAMASDRPMIWCEVVNM